MVWPFPCSAHCFSSLKQISEAAPCFSFPPSFSHNERPPLNDKSITETHVMKPNRLFHNSESSGVVKSSLQCGLFLTQTLPFSAAGIRAGGAFFTRISKGPWLSTLTAAAHTVASPAAHLPIIWNAGRRLCGAVTVVANVTGVAFTLPAVAFSMTWTREEQQGSQQRFFYGTVIIHSCCNKVDLILCFCDTIFKQSKQRKILWNTYETHTLCNLPQKKWATCNNASSQSHTSWGRLPDVGSYVDFFYNDGIKK